MDGSNSYQLCDRVAQSLGRRSLAGGLFLTCTRSMVERWPAVCGRLCAMGRTCN